MKLPVNSVPISGLMKSYRYPQQHIDSYSKLCCLSLFDGLEELDEKNIQTGCWESASPTPLDLRDKDGEPLGIKIAAVRRHDDSESLKSTSSQQHITVQHSQSYFSHHAFRHCSDHSPPLGSCRTGVAQPETNTLRLSRVQDGVGRRRRPSSKLLPYSAERKSLGTWPLAAGARLTGNLTQEVNDCGEATECSVGHEVSKSYTVGWSGGVSGFDFFSGGFEVQESWATGDTYTCTGKTGETVCVWYIVAHTAYTVDSWTEYPGCPTGQPIEKERAVIKAPNKDNAGGKYDCRIGAECRTQGDNYWA